MRFNPLPAARARARPPCRCRPRVHPKPPRVVPRTSHHVVAVTRLAVASHRKQKTSERAPLIARARCDSEWRPPAPSASPLSSPRVRPPPYPRCPPRLPFSPSLFSVWRLILLVAPILTLLPDPIRIQLDREGETSTIGTTGRQRRQRRLLLFHPLCLPSGLCCHPLLTLLDAAASLYLFSSAALRFLPACLPACLCLSLNPPSGLLSSSLILSLLILSLFLFCVSCLLPPFSPASLIPPPSSHQTQTIDDHHQHHHHRSHPHATGRRTPYSRAICCYHQLFASLRSRRGGRRSSIVLPAAREDEQYV